MNNRRSRHSECAHPIVRLLVFIHEGDSDKVVMIAIFPEQSVSISHSGPIYEKPLPKGSVGLIWVRTFENHRRRGENYMQALHDV